MRIVTDTSALYSPTEGHELGIDVLPLSITLDNKSYKEFVDITSEEFLELLRSGGTPTSSQPSIGETMELLERYHEEDVLVINMADGLSGTYQSSLSAKASIDYNEKIHVMNSMTLCGPHRYLVQKAIRLKDEGKDIEEVKKELYKSIALEKSFLIPQDFGFLKRGGRLTPLAATLGSMLKITPILTKTKDGKRLEKFAMKKSFKSAVKEIIKYFQKAGVDETFKVYITHGGVLHQAHETMQQIKEIFPLVDVEIYELSPAFITQGGPGCVAIQFIKK